MTDPYADYFKSLYVKMFEQWAEIWQQTKNPDAYNRMIEFKNLMYDRYLIILEIPEEKKEEKEIKQLELF